MENINCFPFRIDTDIKAYSSTLHFNVVFYSPRKLLNVSITLTFTEEQSRQNGKMQGEDHLYQML